MSARWYENIDRPHFDYELFDIPGLRDGSFRGPECDRSQPHIVCIGAAQTLGRFSAAPFPWQLSLRLGVGVLSLGFGGVGPGFFDRPEYLKVINSADFAVVQVLSGRSTSNSRFDNSATFGQGGIRLADGARMRFRDFLADLFRTESAATIAEIVEETRESYLTQMESLLDRIEVPKLLLWLSSREPPESDDFTDAGTTLGPYPQLVNRAMLERISSRADGLLKVSGDADLPQALWVGEEVNGTEERAGVLYNTYYPSPQKHALVAEKLSEAIPPLARPEFTRRLATSLEATPVPDATIAILVGGRDEATSLLRSALNEHDGVRVAGHILERPDGYGPLVDHPWSTDQEHRRFGELRETAPTLFVRSLMAGMVGQRLVGFALTPERLRAEGAIVEMLATWPNVQVIRLNPDPSEVGSTTDSPLLSRRGAEVIDVDGNALAHSPGATASDVLNRLGVPEARSRWRFLRP